MTRLLTTAEVAARVHKHPKTVERAIRAGHLRATRLSGTKHGPYGVAPEWIDEWITGALVTAAPKSGLIPPLPASSSQESAGTLPLTAEMGRDRSAA